MVPPHIFLKVDNDQGHKLSDKHSHLFGARIDWFKYLSALKPDEVSSWQSIRKLTFWHALSPGEPLLFKLHSLQNYVVGGDFFSHFSLHSFYIRVGGLVSEEWDVFGWKYR